MKVCFLCDLHLPTNKEVLQYKVLDWAIDNIKTTKPDCIIFAGDVACDGNIDVYRWFLAKIQEIGIPYIYIPGNSDLRNPKYKDDIAKMASATKTVINDTVIFSLNDCERKMPKNQLDELEGECADIVFFHHPLKDLDEYGRAFLTEYAKNNPKTMLFHAHLHEFLVSENIVSLPALDPDKNLSTPPALLYYDTVTREITTSVFDCSMPKELPKQFGISCYKPLEQIDFCIENNLVNLELRPNVVNDPQEKIVELIEKWRANGGKNLSVHLPDVVYKEGAIQEDPDLDKLLELAVKIKADRFTQHVPMVSVNTVKAEDSVLEKIADYLANKLDALPFDAVIGVENMHTVASERGMGDRRFGYIPEECIEFMNILDKVTRHKVGINFDIGHARNNAPFSQTYQISTWLQMVGKYVVGYHLHQVVYDGNFHNHCAITEPYGNLISYASFFYCLQNGIINNAPAIFEISQKDGYKITLETFKNL